MKPTVSEFLQDLLAQAVASVPDKEKSKYPAFKKWDEVGEKDVDYNIDSEIQITNTPQPKRDTTNLPWRVLSVNEGIERVQNLCPFITDRKVLQAIYAEACQQEAVDYMPNPEDTAKEDATAFYGKSKQGQW